MDRRVNSTCVALSRELVRIGTFSGYKETHLVRTWTTVLKYNIVGVNIVHGEPRNRMDSMWSSARSRR